MIAVARPEHPEAEFRLGDLLALPARDGEFGAVVALYSVIHLGPGELPASCAEMHRVRGRTPCAVPGTTGGRCLVREEPGIPDNQRLYPNVSSCGVFIRGLGMVIFANLVNRVE